MCLKKNLVVQYRSSVLGSVLTEILVSSTVSAPPNCSLNDGRSACTWLLHYGRYEEGRTFDGPTLFTYGEMSAFSVKEDESAVKKLFPRAQMKQINGAGHWLQAEKPEEFCKALNDFLNDDSP